MVNKDLSFLHAIKNSNIAAFQDNQWRNFYNLYL